MSILKYKSIYVPQIDETDCGAACLAMILKNYHSQVSIAHLRHIAKTNTEGTTALGLVKTAEKFNMDVQAVKADMSLFNMKDIQYPFIVHVIKDGGLLHYYVVLKSTKRKIIVADPDPTSGIKKMSKKAFEKEWTGITLFMVPKADFKPVKEKKNNLLSLFPYMFKQKKLVRNIILAALLMTLIETVK